MTQEKFTTMIRSGNDLIETIRSVPEDKCFLLAMKMDAFLSGVTAGECLLAHQERQTGLERVKSIASDG